MGDVAGIDCGLTLKDPTSGVCRTGINGFLVGHTYTDRLSRIKMLSPVSHIDCLGIDAPVLPRNTLHYDPRPVESLFMRGDFQTRCKPGASHVSGTGQALRRSGCDTAIQFAAETLSYAPAPYPRVQRDQNIVEAFPNAFLGVMLDQQIIDVTKAGRGEKVEVFSSLCNEHGAFTTLENHVGWHDRQFWDAFSTTVNRDELAALVCAATAICAHVGKYVAVGDMSLGYFFLPPWTLWKLWARQALAVAWADRDLCRVIEVWINGTVFREADELPGDFW